MCLVMNVLCLMTFIVSMAYGGPVYDVMSAPMPIFRPPSGFYKALAARDGLIFPVKSIATVSRKPKPGRLQKELNILLKDLPSSCQVKTVSGSFREWQLYIFGPEGSLFANEQFLLKVKFPFEYPYKPPIVYFEKGFVPSSTGGSPVPVTIPKHPHIYSNGDICLSVLGKDWRPNMSTESIVVSVLSLLSSAKTKKLPEDDRIHSEFNFPGQEQKNWQYHDSNV